MNINKTVTAFLTVVLWSCQVTSGTSNILKEVSEQFTGGDATTDAFASDRRDVFPVAYFDMNGDKLTDMITVSKERTSLHVFLAQEQAPYLKRAMSSQEIAGELKILSVRPGDFTGNGVIDLMVTLGENMGIKVDVLFCKINSTSVDCDETDAGSRIRDLLQEPTVLDLNGDMVLDLLGERCIKVSSNESISTCERERTVWLSIGEIDRFEWSTEVFTNRLVKDDGSHTNLPIRNMTRPSSNAFADIDGDSIPELIILTEEVVEANSKSTTLYMETFSVETDSQSRPVFDFKVPPALVTFDLGEIPTLGQPMIVDFQHKGRLSHLVPYSAKSGETFGIYVMHKNTLDQTVNAFSLPLGSLTYDRRRWSYIQSDMKTPFELADFYARSLSLRVGDYNLDGYPDLLGVLQSPDAHQESRSTRAVLFENIPCVPVPESPCRYNRTFSANFDIFKEYSNVISASFYDFSENGALDVILVSKAEATQGSPKESYTLHAFENQMNFDSSFLKVIVLSGKPCGNKSCSGGTTSGNVLPGATIKYTSLNAQGIEETGTAVQTYRTAHMTLDLPCNIFGIGHSPNFIETLEATAPSQDSDKTNTKTWQQIVPNSQIVVSPSLDGSWTMKLFLTPSDMVYNTFLALVAVCGVLAVLAGILEIKDKHEDRKHRQKEAHRLVLWLG